MNFVKLRFCQLRFDGHEAGYLSSEKLSTRNLQAITCQALLAQKHLLQLILEKIDTDFTDYPAAIKDAACLKVLVPSFNSNSKSSKLRLSERPPPTILNFASILDK